MLTVRDALQHGRAFLEGQGSLVRGQTAALDAEVILRHLLGLSRAALYAELLRRLPADSWECYQTLLRRRAAAEPVAYLTGRREFMGLDFAVDRRVLVPRPETELLVELALAALKGSPSPWRVGAGGGVLAVDVGTGSGAIAVSLVALAHGIAWRRVIATDVDAGALHLARENATRLLGAASRLVFPVRCRYLSALRGPFHLILANLPYVASAELATLAPSVAAYEPRLALDGGADGLDPYRALLEEAPGKLLPGGVLLMECDPRQAASLRGLASRAFGGVPAQEHRDLAGRERVVSVSAPHPPAPSRQGEGGSLPGVVWGREAR
jgi:release factor glutamine methyltransferase